jgi:hypothetical protein
MALFPRQRRSTLLLVMAAWCLLVGLGARSLLRYETTQGQAAVTSARWPEGVWLPLARDRQTLLVFLHPHCPCSRASVEELAQLLAQTQDHLAVQVVFFVPEGRVSDVTGSALWKSVAALPGVALICDVDGALARQFDAHTSGQVYQFDPDGQLLFSGGVTASRGHIGDNGGLNAIVELAHQPGLVLRGPAHSPVFGCEISCPMPPAQGASTPGGETAP